MHVKTVNVTNPRNVLVQVPSLLLQTGELHLAATWRCTMTKKNSNLPSSQVYSDEGTLLKKVMEWLESQQRERIKAIRVCDRYNKGYSDVFICVHGVLVLAELKNDTGTPTPHQEIFLDEMRAAGAIGGICRSVKDVAGLVEQAKQLIE